MREKYQLLPDLPPDQFEALKALWVGACDIAAHQNPLLDCVGQRHGRLFLQMPSG
jgi:hypothetical protein